MSRNNLYCHRTIIGERPQKARLTRDGGIIGTPIYMSPEQAAGMDLDTRCDVYSLTMLLYELLVGTSPFDEETFSKANLLYQVYLVQKGEIDKPSARLKSQAGQIDLLARNRRTTPRQLHQLLRGDLDAIIAKGLARKREDRYNSMNEPRPPPSRHSKFGVGFNPMTD